ncbi:hypothetical protein [Nocardia sp. NPDC048505]|uniref:hypothetical protein n=1 Tax=unclassified Nocardia TaxID=2637762 RepID=UPI003402EA12
MVYIPFSFNGLDFTAKHNLLSTVCETLFHQLPPGWFEVTIDYRQVGRHVETVSVVHTIDKRIIPIQTPSGARELFAAYRQLMSRPHEGTWYSLRFHYARMNDYSVNINWTDDPFTQPVPDDEFLFELDKQWIDEVPSWFAGQSAEFSKAAAYGYDEWGLEVNDRPPLPPKVIEQVAAYLDAAPTVYTNSSPWPDPLDPEEPEVIPPHFYTDGAWIWPEDVPYQLRTREMSPEPEFLAHILENNFTLPEVSETALRDARLQAAYWMHTKNSRAD